MANRLADAVCDNLGPCCQSAGIGFDAETCKQNVIAKLSPEIAEDTGPNVAYDADAAGRCVAAYESGVSSCTPVEQIDESACRAVFMGALPAGGVCTQDAECANAAAGDAYCDMSSGAGSCVKLPGGVAHGKLGDACVSSCDANSCVGISTPERGADPNAQFNCYQEDGLFCDASYTCQPLLDAGAGCASSDDCKAGLYCDAGTCAVSKANGANCQGNQECAGGDCVFSPSTSADGVCGKSMLATADACAGMFF
ncbi:MAG TPA: hypothetical protein VGM44_00505 [Polyangiaceae bacterium]